MTIDVLVCYPDGRQVLERREVPADWFEPMTPPAPLSKDEIPVE